ncbi:MAG: hypothetical protein ACFCUR_19170 [Rhodomicrobiaceae bacterium]
MDHSWIDHLDHGLEPDELAKRIFAGRILVFEELKPMARLVAATRTLLDEVFKGLQPTRAFAELGHDAYRERMKSARTHFRKSDEVNEHYADALIAAGCDPRTTYADRFSLRNAPPFDAPYVPGFGALPAHRDSWGAGLDCQINWWFPFYELTAERTMALFPRYWSEPIANDSEGWRWQRALKEADYPSLPTAQEEVDWTGAIYLTIPPEALVAFSGSHLHASVPNTSNKARISSDTRTIDLAHLRDGYGAPNIDRGTVSPSLK